MTLKEAYEIGKERLQAAGIQEFELDAFYLLEYLTGITRAKFYADYQKELEGGVIKRYNELLAKRAKRVPLQHLTGEQEFMGLSFFVNEDVLIPRQDTETLVEAGLEILRNLAKSEETPRNRKKISFLDMCTGSGCILLSILKHVYDKGGLFEYSQEMIQPLEHPVDMPRLAGTGVDISNEALAVAKKNAKRIFPEYAGGNPKDEIRITLLHSDLFDKVAGKFDLIVSNPPYIDTPELRQLAEEVRCHEPRVALDGGNEGMWFYRRIVQESKDYLLPGGHLLLEIGASQGREVADLLKSHGYEKIKITKDLAGFDRVVQATITV